MSSKEEKFTLKMKELHCFLQKEALNSDADYETLLLGAMNGVLAYHALITDKEVPFHMDISKFKELLNPTNT